MENEFTAYELDVIATSLYFVRDEAPDEVFGPSRNVNGAVTCEADEKALKAIQETILPKVLSALKARTLNDANTDA